MRDVKPAITRRARELLQIGLAQTRNKGVERLLDAFSNPFILQELANTHSATPEKAVSTKEQASSIPDESRSHPAKLGLAPGVHGSHVSLLLTFRDNA